MLENQDVEFKAIWKDEYLKWICGMANANGGIIYIGKDDKGKVIGINNAIKLVKEIPNKIRDTMGIIPEVKIEEEKELLYIVIKVDSYPMPISYQGKFYLRSGSNNHEVTGSELDKFMLDRAGKRWEDLPVKNATFNDLSEEAFKVFREKAVKNGRLKAEEVEINDETLLKNLGLYDGNYLNKAAILLFGKDPNKWVVGPYIKIGFFEDNDDDLRYQDEVQGALILQVDSIYDDKIYVWNDGKFPEELASQNLFEKHYSKPYNPLIAQTFFKAGFIESWGRGFEKIKRECEQDNTPIPEIEIKTSGVMVKCNPSKIYMDLLSEMKGKNVHKNVQINNYEKLTKIEKQILDVILKNPEITQVNMANTLKTTPKTVQRGIAKLKENEIIERVGSNKKGYWKIKE